MRGEHTGRAPRHDTGRGSSPHARGARKSENHTRLVLRLIPACAGSTCPRHDGIRSPGAHPRMRGEHLYREGSGEMFTGSSPHARGARPSHDRHHSGRRLIPACAGSTHGPSRQDRSRRAHPRMRGEHRASIPPPSPANGSSPHARGAQKERLEADAMPGLIPACAGSTGLRHLTSDPARAHPRMRGEHSTTTNAPNSTGGSSPHARGARDPGGRRPRDGGLIPACAGSTCNYSGTG